MFSIVIPMFNASEFIHKTLDSCINGMYLPIEIILVDDCSQDDSVKIINEYIDSYNGSVKIRSERLKENSGPSVARNRGWDLAIGEYVAFLDADDTFVAEKLAIIYEILCLKKDCILLGHDYTIGTEAERGNHGLLRLHTKDFLKKNYFTTSAVIIKRDIVERFDENMRYTEDQDLFLRVTEKYDKTYWLKQSLVLRDRGMNEIGGLSGDLWEMRKGEIQMYKNFCKSNDKIMLYRQV